MNYNMLVDNQITEYFIEHKIQDQHNLLIMGEGFDSRMCKGLECLSGFLENSEIWKIHYAEAKDSQSEAYKSLIDENIKTFNSLTKSIKTELAILKMWTEGSEERYIAEIQATKFIKDNQGNIGIFDNVIIDISALPQSIYYPMLIKLFRDWIEKKNIFILATENYMTDMNTHPVELAETAHKMHGFVGTGNVANDEGIIVWFPVLGEINPPMLQKYYDYLQKTYSKINEICPVLPFPSVDVRRLDTIIDSYRNLIFSQWQIEKGNLIYVAENNPFQVYRKLFETATHYDKVMKPIGKCRYVFSTITSKLMGIGTLLSSYALRDDGYSVDFLNISNKGYMLNKSGTEISSQIYCLCMNDKGL